MNTKLLAASLLSAATLIGCADKIEVPDDNNGNVTRTENKIVYNRVQNQSDDYAFIDMIDSNGGLLRNVGAGLVTGTGNNAIVFAKQLPPPAQKGAAEIYVSDANGGNVRLVAMINNPGQQLYGFPTISYDGSTIAYATRDSINENRSERVLHVVKADGSNHVVITRSLDYETGFGLSPGGQRIAYYTGPDVGTGPNAQLMVAFTDGSGSTTLLSNVSTGIDFSMNIAWSHQHEKIAFGTQDASFGYRVNVINADGSGLQEVGEGLYPTWSEDDLALAWSAKTPSHTYDIAVTHDLGLTVDFYTNTAEYESNPQFSMDGRKILCLMRADDDELGGTLKLIDLASRDVKVLSTSSYTGFWIK